MQAEAIETRRSCDQSSCLSQDDPGRECVLLPAVGMGISKNAVNWIDTLMESFMLCVSFNAGREGFEGFI